MSESESHDIDEQTIVYEEEEVLWAKIRGYPWWPAFVDKVHGAKSNSDDEIEYTVFFFGDNTHSRLGASKLRRFLDYYTEFFPKAKTNRKLYLSIMKAEQKLKQNGGNIEIFQTLRNSLKKSKKGKGHHRTQSKIDSEDNLNNISQEPQLIRNKTFPNHESKQLKQNASDEQDVEEQKRVRRRGRKSKRIVQKQEKEPSQKMQVQSQRSEEDQQKQELEQPKILNYRTRSGRARNQVTAKVEQNKQLNSQEEKEEQEQSENEQVAKKSYPLRYVAKTKPISRGAPKKRGRPKKVIEQNNGSSSEQSQQQASQNSQHKNTPQLVRPTSTVQNRKSRQDRNAASKSVLLNKQSQKQKLNQQTSEKYETSQQTKQLILQRVKFCLDKRLELIEYLDELNVTTDIIQNILDLDVTTVILEGGDTTAQSIRVLQKLKSVLLHKYFPDDIKLRKKYQKLTKKAQSLKTNTTQNEESLQDLELRRKTLIKLQKILRNIQESTELKEKVIQIESYFRKYDESIGTGYKTIAYKVLRSLKDKNHSVEEIMGKLEAGEFDEDSK